MSVESMTGHGRANAEANGVAIAVEVRSVNHRYLDISLRLPQLYGRFEGMLNAVVREYVQRGKVELFVQRLVQGGTAAEPRFNEAVFKTFLESYKKLFVGAGIVVSPGLLEQLALRVLAQREVNESLAEEVITPEEEAALAKALRGALEELRRMRRQEGASLELEVQSYLTQLKTLRDDIAAKVALTVDELKERLLQRISKVAPELHLNEERFLQEVVLIAERIDVSEELGRLESHLEQFRQYLKEESTGRKLDFLLQEMFREVNTCGSKVQQAAVAKMVVEAKFILEKLREQIQNFE